MMILVIDMYFQIWDYRHPNTCLVEFPAHSGPVFALDFHPEDKFLLASGGRDKLIKVQRKYENNISFDK